MRSSGPSVRGVALLALLMSSSLPATTGPTVEEATWTRVDSEHFSVFSGAGRSAGLEIARRLELLHSALSQLANGESVSPLPTLVYVFADDTALQPFKPALADGRRGSGRAVAGGFFAPRELGNYVAVNARTSQPASETIQHEYLHYFARHNLPRLPFWFDEGLAEYYSTFEVVDGEGVVGLPVRQNLHRLAARPDGLSRAALAELESTRSDRDLYDDADRAASAYAASWAVVHYLLSDDRRAETTMAFLRELADGSEPDQAFHQAFGRPLGSFSAELRAFLAAGDFPTFRTSLEDVIEPRMAPLSDAERDVALADLALQVDRRDLARRLFEDAWDGAEALVEGDRSATVEGRVLLGRARLDLLDGNAERAAFLAHDARALLPDSFEPALVEAGAELQRALTVSENDARERRERLASARRLFREVLRVAPDLVLAHVGLARSWVHDPELQRSEVAVEETEDALTRALELEPRRPDVSSLLATVHTLGGRFDRAERLLRRERHRYPDQRSWEDALIRLVRLELRLVEQWLGTPRWDPEELGVRLERLEDVARGGVHLGDVHREIDALRERLAPR